MREDEENEKCLLRKVEGHEVSLYVRSILKIELNCLLTFNGLTISKSGRKLPVSGRHLLKADETLLAQFHGFCRDHTAILIDNDQHVHNAVQ